MSEISIRPAAFDDLDTIVDFSARLASESEGVELDREALAKLHRSYLNCGLKNRNDEIEMQKIEPDWTFKPTRW